LSFQAVGDKVYRQQHWPESTELPYRSSLPRNRAESSHRHCSSSSSSGPKVRWSWDQDKIVGAIVALGGGALLLHGVFEIWESYEVESWELTPGRITNLELEEVSSRLKGEGRCNVAFDYHFHGPAGDIVSGKHKAILHMPEARKLRAAVDAGEPVAVSFDRNRPHRHVVHGDWGNCGACTIVRSGAGAALMLYGIYALL